MCNILYSDHFRHLKSRDFPLKDTSIMCRYEYDNCISYRPYKFRIYLYSNPLIPVEKHIQPIVKLCQFSQILKADVSTKASASSIERSYIKGLNSNRSNNMTTIMNGVGSTCELGTCQHVRNACLGKSTTSVLTLYMQSMMMFSDFLYGKIRTIIIRSNLKDSIGTVSTNCLKMGKMCS